MGVEREAVVPFKKSPRWAFMHRRLIGSGEDIYLDRTYIVQTPWFGILFHRIHRPDNQRDLHDHPWSFLSIVLRGTYEENVPCRTCPDDPPHTRIREVRWLNWKRAEDRHRISWCSRKPIWTLVFTGPKRRTWGFWVDGGTRFVKWTEYEKVEQP